MPHRILIVESSESVVFGLRRYFEIIGYQVRVALGRDEATQAVASERFAAVLTVLRPPRASSSCGLEVLDCVRKCSPGTPVVMFSGPCQATLEAEARQKGARAVLQIPRALRDIAGVVDRLVGCSA